MNIRTEKKTDAQRIRQIHEAAFNASEEADLVDAVRKRNGVSVSLVAEEKGTLTGHVMFSAALVMTDNVMLSGAALAPLAVLPEWQRRGIGSALVKRGLKILRERGCAFVVVLGHPEYYHRFGFFAAEEYGLVSEFLNLPPGVFMVYVIDKDRLPEHGGVVQYRPEFAMLSDP